MVDDIKKEDLERAVLVWENGKVPDDILDFARIQGIERYEIMSVALIPQNQVMQHGLPTSLTHSILFGKKQESFPYKKYTLLVGYSPMGEK